PRQALAASFTRSGIEVTASSYAGDAWRWGMRLEAYGRGGRLEPVAIAEPSASANRVEYRHGVSVTEWYVNTSRGLEQGFTLHQRLPGHDSTRLELSLAVSGDLVPRLTPGGEQVHFVSND